MAKNMILKTSVPLKNWALIMGYPLNHYHADDIYLFTGIYYRSGHNKTTAHYSNRWLDCILIKENRGRL